MNVASSSSLKRSISQTDFTDKPGASRRKLEMPLEVVRNVFDDATHARMNEAVLAETAEEDFSKVGLLGAAVLLVTIVSSSEGLLDLKYKDFMDAKALIRRHPELLEKLKEAWNIQAFKDIRNLKILRASAYIDSENNRDKKGNQLLEVSIAASVLATELSWEQPYIGDAAEVLWGHITKHHKNRFPSGVSIYAHFLAIVQSSGMGKSRTVDEMSKTHFVIPINLRNPEGQGFPASDTVAYHFLMYPASQGEAFLRAHAFVTSIFIETATAARQLVVDGTDHKDLPGAFRHFMTDGQKMRVHNKNRQRFYTNVVERAAQMLVEAKKPRDEGAVTSIGSQKSPVPKLRYGDKEPLSVTDAADILIRCLLDEEDHDPPPSPTPGATKSSAQLAEMMTKTKALDPPPLNIDEPVIVLAFDEAHTLTNLNQESLSSTWSAFSELLRCLRALNEHRLFSIFLSTTARITRFTSAERDCSPTPVQISGKLLSINPFSDLGFDQLARKIALDGSCTLEEVTSDAHMVTLGRPLFCSRYHLTKNANIRLRIVRFATEKLLNATQSSRQLTPAQKLSCLSHRLPIEFHWMTHTSSDQEQKQVEAHMRVCLQVLPGFEGMTTTCPSEPILSEAAYDVMSNPNFGAPRALQEVMTRFSIDKGDRGEFVVMLLFTLARDRAVAQQKFSPGYRVITVNKFLKNLFRQSDMILATMPSDAYKKSCTVSETKLADAFDGAKIHFNHFVKVHQRIVIKREYLLRLVSRGAAVLCATGQTGVDGIIPFIYKESKLQVENVGVILWQSKNDSAYTSEPDRQLFDAMDPFKLGIFDRSKDSECIPIIRIVFALAAKTPSVKISRVQTMSGSFTAYDIWCSGISSDIQSPIAPEADDVWRSLVLASHGWQTIYDAPDRRTKALRMSMNPGTAEDPAFWERWT